MPVVWAMSADVQKQTSNIRTSAPWLGVENDPTPLRKSFAHEVLIIFRCLRRLSPVPAVVTEPTSGHDVLRIISAAVASRMEVFCRTPTRTWGSGLQHGAATVPAFPVLAGVSLITQLAELWHWTSKINYDPESCRDLHRRPCTRPLQAGNGPGVYPNPDVCWIRILMLLITRKLAHADAFPASRYQMG
jgi:hypothetical protein